MAAERRTAVAAVALAIRLASAAAARVLSASPPMDDVGVGALLPRLSGSFMLMLRSRSTKLLRPELGRSLGGSVRRTPRTREKQPEVFALMVRTQPTQSCQPTPQTHRGKSNFHPLVELLILGSLCFSLRVNEVDGGVHLRLTEDAVEQLHLEDVRMWRARSYTVGMDDSSRHPGGHPWVLGEEPPPGPGP